VKLSVQDMGQLVKDAWYDSDCEHWGNVQGIETKRPLFTPLRDKFQNCAHAVTEFKAFCEANDIAAGMWLKALGIVLRTISATTGRRGIGLQNSIGKQLALEGSPLGNHHSPAAIGYRLRNGHVRQVALGRLRRAIPQRPGF